MNHTRALALSISIAGLTALSPVAVAQARELFVTNTGSGVNETAIFESAGHTRVGAILGSATPEPSGLLGLTFSSDGARAYVTFVGNPGYVGVIDTGSGKTVAMIQVDDDPVGQALTPDGRKLYVTNTAAFSGGTDRSVSVIDTTSNSIIARITLPVSSGGPLGVAMTPDGTRAYVTGGSASGSCGGAPNNVVNVIDTSTDAVSQTISCAGIGPAPIAITPNGTRAYIGNLNSCCGVTMIDTDPLSPTYNQVIRGISNPIATGGSFHNGVALTPGGTRAYVTDSPTNADPGAIYVIDTDPASAQYNTVIGTITAGVNKILEAVALNSTGTAGYFGSNIGPTPGDVSVLNTATNAVSTPAGLVGGLSEAPGAVTVAPNDSRVWVTRRNPAQRISKIDTSTNSVVSSESIDSFARRDLPYAAAITPNARYAYIANEGDASVKVADVATRSVEAKIDVGSEPLDIAIGPDGRRAYVTNYLSHSVSVVDTASRSVVATIVSSGSSSISYPDGVAVSPSASRAYVSSAGSNAVAVIDTSTNAPVGSIAVGSLPAGMSITPDGSRLYVANSGSNNVSVIDTSSAAVIVTVPVGDRPVRVAIGPDGRRAYVANYGASGNVSVIDVATNTVIGSIAGVGSGAFGISLAPDGTRGYVARSSGNTISVFDAASNSVWGSFTSGNPGATPTAITPVPDQSPVARLSASSSPAAASTRGAAGSAVTFDASASTDADGTIARYTWDFGDGEIQTTTTPTVSHTYGMEGRYVVRVTLTDDEGCSTSLVFTGQTAYCSGSKGAEADSATTSLNVEIDPATASDDQCISLSGAPSPSHKVDRVRTRVRVSMSLRPAGVILGSHQRARFMVTANHVGRRGRSGGKVKLARVVFRLDGDTVKSQRRAPYVLTLNPASIDPGRHSLAAVVRTASGARVARTLRFDRIDCDKAAFLARLTQPSPGRYTNMELQARSGGAALRSVVFALPRNLTVNSSRALADKKLGRVSVATASGKTVSRTLKFRRRLHGAAVLLAGRKLAVRMRGRGAARSIRVDLPGMRRVNAVQLFVKGKRFARLFRLKRRCQGYTFKARLKTRGGERQTLVRTVRPRRCG